MSSLERYTKSIEPMLLSVENGNALAAVEAIIVEAQAGSLTKTNAEYIRSIKMTLRRIVSARKELALHANGLKVALKTLTKLNGGVK
jgi:hypothetical protein